jgi:hypothetical protein
MSVAENSMSKLFAQKAELEAEMVGWQNELDALRERIANRIRLLQALEAEADFARSRLFEPPLSQAATSPGESQNGNGTAPNGVRPKRTSDAVLLVLDESHSKSLSSDEVFVELEKRGWAPLDARDPKNTVRTALWGLAEKDKIKKLGKNTAKRRWAAKEQAPASREGPP